MRTSLLVALLATPLLAQFSLLTYANFNMVGSYFPSGYNALGLTSHVSGALSDLQFNDSAYMTFRSYDTSASNLPITNMNFTSDSAGWTYSEVDARGYASDGGWQSSGGNTLGSGGGNHRVTYNDNDNKQPASAVTDVMRLTCSFSTPSSTWDTQKASFAWKYSLDSGSYTTQTLTVKLQLQNATDFLLETLYSTSIMQTSWQYLTNLDITSALSTSATYKLQLEFSIVNGGAGNKANTFQVSIYWDDAGVRLKKAQQTLEVEFSGVSNTQGWTQLAWIVDSSWTAASVSITLQLYNFALAAYPTSGDGYIVYTSSATADTDETRSQTVTTNSTDFRDASGNWKIKIRGVKATSTSFDLNADLIEYETTFVALHDVAVANVTASPTSVSPGQNVTINVTVQNQGDVAENFNVTVFVESTQIGKQLVTDLVADANITLLFTWNSTGVAQGSYTIKAVADTVPGETDIADNTLIDGAVTVESTHDVAVESVALSSTKVFLGDSVNITVIVKNEGKLSETFNVTTYHNNTAIATQTVVNLASDTNQTLIFVWNTTGVAAGTYTIKAVADVVLGEVDTADNTFIDGTVRVVIATVCVSPSSTMGPPPNIYETFQVNLTITDALSLYSWQAGMTFNPAVLEALDFVEGPFLRQGGTTIWLKGSINNNLGIIRYHACSLTGPVPGVSGNGTLGTITFRIRGYGASSLHLTDVTLLDSTLIAMPRNVVDGYFELAGYSLSLRILDWDLTDHIQGASVYKDSDVKISDANGWANWTGVTGTVEIKVMWWGFWVNGTFTVAMDSNKVIDVQCNVFDIMVVAVEGVQGAVLENTNVTIYNGMSFEANKIQTAITGSDGKVSFLNVPNATLTFTVYDSSLIQHVIANVTRTVTTEDQEETVVCDQNFVSAGLSWSIIGSYSGSMFSLGSAVFGLCFHSGWCLKGRTLEVRPKHKKEENKVKGGMEKCDD